jgi:hypothetical protein
MIRACRDGRLVKRVSSQLFRMTKIFTTNMHFSGHPLKWLTQQNEPLDHVDAYGGINVLDNGRGSIFVIKDHNVLAGTVLRALIKHHLSRRDGKTDGLVRKLLNTLSVVMASEIAAAEGAGSRPRTRSGTRGT